MRKSRIVFRPAALAAVGVSALAAVAIAPATASSGATRMQSVIVTGQPGELAAVAAAVHDAHGTDIRTLRVVDGVVARVPADAVPALRHAAGVRSVSADAEGHLMGIDPTLGYDVSSDEGSLYDVAQVTHAKDVWNKGFTGAGVGVALIDSGVSPVAGLTSGNVTNGPDISFDSQNADLTDLDGYGHGTHMASIIVGRDQVGSGKSYAALNNHQFDGIAPDAQLISVKVGAADGAADVSQVIAAIDWVTEHAASQNIKVLNLSYGTDSTQDPSVDPLDYAVENAWRAGITVVVSAGNDGTNRQQLADPANDPLVLAVGADDPMGTDGVADDQVPPFSQRGTSTRHVDVIAPGVHILGLRDPGSVIDQANPLAVVNQRFFRGSGTSQAAAVVSGLAALYVSRYPSATPDQVKAALMQSAVPPKAVKTLYAGLGVPDINKAIGAKLPTDAQAAQPATGATGTGSLESARGSSHVSDGTSTLSGEVDIFGSIWDPASWSAASAAGTAWNGGTYNGNSWSGNSWSGNSWAGNSWAGNSWAGNSWASNDWAGNSWAGNSWAGHSWAGNSWAGNSWAGNSWAGNSWSGNSWSGNSWSGNSWSGNSWSAASWS